MGQLDMVPVAVTRDQFEARLIAARLGSEGIVWELRGAAGGPYPVGQVAVLVERADLEVAREVLSSDEAGGDGADATDERAPLLLWVALLVIVAIAASGLLRALAAG